MSRRSTTRERILAAALHLFARRGYRATTVGAIEAKAGLAPRRGGFYRHFPSKAAVLVATVEHHAAELRGLPATLARASGADVRRELAFLASWGLAFLRRQTDLLRIVARTGDVPRAVRERVRRHLIEPGYEIARERFAGMRAVDPEQARGVAAVALGSLVHYVEDEALHGTPPAGAREEQFIAAWVDVFAAWAAGATPPRRGSKEDVP